MLRGQTERLCLAELQLSWGVKRTLYFQKIYLFVFIHPFCYNTLFFFLLPTFILMKFLLSILFPTTLPELSLAAPVEHCTDCSYKNLLVHTRSLPMPSLHISLWEVMWVSLDFFKTKCTFGKIPSLELLVSSATGLVELKQQMMIRC